MAYCPSWKIGLALYYSRGVHIKGLTHKRRNDHIPAISQAKQVAWLALIAIGGIIYFIVAVLVLHSLRPEYNPINHAVSNYAVGPYGYLMTAAFYVLALSIFALALGLFRSIALTKLSRMQFRTRLHSPRFHQGSNSLIVKI